MKTLNLFLLFFFISSINSYSLPKCEGGDPLKWNNCLGTFTFQTGLKYVGEFKNGTMDGQGTFTYPNGDKRVGVWRDGKPVN